MPNGVADHSDGEKPNGEKRGANLFLDSNGCEKPDRDPDEIEGHEKLGRPRHETEKLRCPHIKGRHEFLREVEALTADADQVEAEHPIYLLVGIFRRPPRYRQDQRDDSNPVEDGGTENHAAHVFAHGIVPSFTALVSASRGNTA